MQMNIVLNSSVDAYVGPAISSFRTFINETFSAPASTRFITDPCVDLSQWTVSGNNGNQFSIANDTFYIHRDPVDTRYNDLASSIAIPSDQIIKFDLHLKAPTGTTNGGTDGGSLVWFRGGAYGLEYDFGWDANNNINFVEFALWKDPNSSQVETTRLFAMFPDLSLFSSLNLNTEAVLPNITIVCLGGSIKVFAGNTLLIDATDPTPVVTPGYIQFYPARNIDTIGFGNMFIGAYTPDPSTWAAFGAGEILNGQYFLPLGEAGGLNSVQTIPANATYQMDVIVPNCPEGDQYFGICGVQYAFETQDYTYAVGTNMFLQCHNGTITGCQIQNNDGLFYINVPLNLLQITGNTVVFPQFKIQITPNLFTLSIAGTQVVSWSSPVYQPFAGHFFVANDAYSGVALAFDNILVTAGVAAWQGLNGLPGITVLQGGVLTAPLDTKGHGHASDILPVGTNYAILALVRGRENHNRVIDGFKTLASLEGPHHTGEDWDKMDNNVGGLIFYGALNSTAKTKFQTLMAGYTAQYAYKAVIDIHGYVGPIGAGLLQSLNSLPGVTVLQGGVLTAPLDTKGHGHAQDILPTGTNYGIILLERAKGALGNFDGFASLQALVQSGQNWDKIDDNVGGLIFYGALNATAKAKYQAVLNGYGQQYI